MAAGERQSFCSSPGLQRRQTYSNRAILDVYGSVKDKKQNKTKKKYLFDFLVKAEREE